MKKRSLVSSPGPAPALCAAAILTGAFGFSGDAAAATIFAEDFDGATNQFSMPTYAYSQNYTAAHTLSPGGGAKYAHGGPGIDGSVSSNSFSATTNPVSLLVGGVTAAAVDAGGISYNFYAQFSTYKAQADYAEVLAEFFDASNGLLSSARVGGPAVIGALTPAGNVVKDWLADTNTGIVPAGARTVSFTVTETKTAGGLVIDGYLDNVRFSVDPVPEPAASILVLGAFGLGLRRRRA